MELLKIHSKQYSKCCVTMKLCQKAAGYIREQGAHPMHLTPKSALVSFIENFMTHNSFHFTSFATSINSCSNGTSLETMVIFKLMKQGDR